MWVTRQFKNVRPCLACLDWFHIGSAQRVVIGDQAQTTQVFGGEPSSRPGQGGTGSHQPPSGDAAKRHWRQQLAELQRRYETLSNRIAALDKDLGRTLDGETKLTLKERRQELVTERDQTAQEMAQIERQLNS